MKQSNVDQYFSQSRIVVVYVLCDQDIASQFLKLRYLQYKNFYNLNHHAFELLDEVEWLGDLA